MAKMDISALGSAITVIGIGPGRLTVFRPHHQLDLGWVELAEPLFAIPHQLAANAPTPAIARNGEIIDPAAVTIPSGHVGADQMRACESAEDRGRWPLKSAFCVCHRVVP